MHFVSVDDSCSIISCYYDEVFAFWVLAWFFGIFICPFTLQIVLSTVEMTFMNVLSFLVKYLWNLYLFNGIVGSWIIIYLPWIYESPVNKGCYLHYALVIIVGTALAYCVNRFCEKALKKN